jgi:hypothetical protein
MRAQAASNGIDGVNRFVEMPRLHRICIVLAWLRAQAASDGIEGVSRVVEMP